MKLVKPAALLAAALIVGIASGIAISSTDAWAQARPVAQQKAAAAKVHKVAIQVNQNEKGVMDLALNNAKNVVDYYKGKGEQVVVEIVTYGPGLHMLRSESPVKERVAAMSLELPQLTFAACGNTQASMSKAEGKPVTLLSEAKVTPSGVVRLMELQGQGYAYIRP
ncbi:MAG: DsrE family protein [Hyphomicrobiaceae bacterium]|nr:DsrE family protein [Hyphomicrobiaceae bacterium]